MPETTTHEERKPNGWKRALGIWAAAPLAATALLVPSFAADQDAADQDAAAPHDHATRAESRQDALARVRASTAQFHRVEEAIAAGYELGWVNGSGVRIVAGCVSHPTAGAMGYHYFNSDLMADNGVDVRRPEVLVYAPRADGGLRLVAVEWVVRGPRSNPPGVSEPPSVLGMDMHVLVPPPGPAFYLTHAWIWAHNPAGMFADFNPEVSCP